MNYKIQTEPNAEPVTLDEAKLHLRVDIDADDTLIESYIVVARRTAEMISNHRMVTQTWDIKMDSFPGTIFTLPKSLSPLVSVTHIKYTDEDDATTEFSSANYVVDTYSDPARIKLADGAAWPSDVLVVLNGVEIRVIVGYGAPGDVPQEIKQAMYLMLGEWYENREDIIVGTIVANLPRGVKSLLMLDRNIPV